MSFTIFYPWDPSDPPRYHNAPVDRDYFDWLFSNLAGTGVTFLYRCNLSGRAYYPSKLLQPWDESVVEPNNLDAQIWLRVADIFNCGDPFAEAVAAARRHDVPIWAWYNWNEFQCTRRDWLYLQDNEWYERPRKYWCSRDGSRFYHGIPDFGDAEVQARLLGLAKEVAGYQVDGFYVSTRSHSWFACWDSPGWRDHLEPFGFNDSVVQAYRERHGVDIRYDDFDEEEWLKIKGEQFSQVIAQTGTLMHDHDMPFVIGISPHRYELCVEFINQKRAGGEELKLYKDWEGWAANGWIDGICAEQACPNELVMQGSDPRVFRDTLPAEFPLYSWADTARWINRDGKPFSLYNWDRHPVETVLQQIEWAQDIDAAGVFLHSLYHYTACDSSNESIGGYGVLPRTEYLDALRQRQS